MKQAFEASNENIQELADRFEISNLLLDVATAIDSNDRAALGVCFSARAGAERWLPNSACNEHQITNAEICINGDTATARSFCYSPDQPSAKALLYVDTLQRTQEGWRISERASQNTDC